MNVKTSFELEYIYVCAHEKTRLNLQKKKIELDTYSECLAISGQFAFYLMRFGPVVPP